MALPTITIEFQQTAIKGGKPVTGVMEFTYDRVIDVMSAWVRVPDGDNPKAFLKGEHAIDPGVVSEVGVEDIEYLKFNRYDVPSKVKLRKYKVRWQADMPYAAAVIAGYFDADPALIRQHLAAIS